MLTDSDMLIKREKPKHRPEYLTAISIKWSDLWIEAKKKEETYETDYCVYTDGNNAV